MRLSEKFQTLMTAAAFAEENEHATALQIADEVHETSPKTRDSLSRLYLQTALFGAVSIALYVLLLARQDLINENVARGGLYALLPIVMAFVFSYFHGNFTGYFWTSCGIEASKKTKGVK